MLTMNNTGSAPALETFLTSFREGRSPAFDAARKHPGVPTLESLVLAHLTNQALPASLSISADGPPAFVPTAAKAPLPTQVTKTLKGIHASNVLSVKPTLFPRRYFDTTKADWVSEVEECIATTAVDKAIKVPPLERCACLWLTCR